MAKLEIGCCGAYCKTCKAYVANKCKGCKIGYTQKQRDLSKARCKIKVCCINNHYVSCADCIHYEQCDIIQKFHHHQGYKYSKYRQSIAYIIQYGYENFLEKADSWHNAYGHLKD